MSSFLTTLKGKVAIVTSGASGIGYAVVHSLLEAGAKVGISPLICV